VTYPHHNGYKKKTPMNITTNAEVAVTSDSSRLCRRGQGGKGGAARAQNSSSKEKDPRPDSARRDSDRTFEGAGAKGPQGSPLTPEPTVACQPPSAVALDGVEPGAGWRQVLSRRRVKDHLDRRSLIIWGLPTNADAGRFSALLKSKATCWWRGRAAKRHMVVEFATRLAFTAMEQVTRVACEDMGVKVAGKTRDWQLRQQHRQSKPAPEVLPPPANRYLVIADESEVPFGRLEPLAVDPIEPLVVDLTEHRNRRTTTCPSAGAASVRPDVLKELMPHPSPRVASSKRAKRRTLPGSGQSVRRAAKAKLGKELKADTIRVGSLNVRGGMTRDIAEYEDYAVKKGYDVLAIQESRLGPSTKLSAKGYKVIRQEAKLEDTGHGVLILVVNHLAVAVTRERSTVSNQLWIRISGMGAKKDMFLCSAYMPQENDSAEATVAFAALLESAKGYAGRGKVVVMGDLNAKLRAATNAQELRVLGGHCEPGKRSRNGNLLLQVMKAAGLVSLSGQFRPPDSVPAAAEAGFWWTRKDPRTSQMHTIDYVLVSAGLTSAGTNFWVDYTDLNSDHHLIGADIDSPRVVVRQRGRKKPRRRFKMDTMIQRSSSEVDVKAAEASREQYQTCLGESFTGFVLGTQRAAVCDCIGTCVCAGVVDFVRRTMQAAEQSAGSVEVGRKFSRSWFDDEVKTAIAERRAAHAVFLRSGSELDWAEYERRRRACTRLVKQKKRADWQKFEEEMEDAFRSGDHKKLYELIDRLAPSGKKATVEPILRKDGTLAKSEEQILEAWGDHQETLGTPKAHELEDAAFGNRVLMHVREAEKLSRSTPDAEVDRPFTIEDITEGVDKLAYHKAGTADGTVNTMFKCGGAEMAKHLLHLFNWLREKESLPAEWQRSMVVNLFKEGDKADPGNYRGIALISCLGKLYLSLWATRIARHADHRLGERQGGFRAGRSTVDQALILHEALLRRKRAGKETFLCFVDFRKAFDTVWHEGLWKRMWDTGIRGKAWRVTRNLYSSINACVKLGDKTSRNVSMRQGVRQGCPLSPILFNLFVEALAERLRKSGFGAKIKGIDLESLLYADDVVLLGESTADLQGLIDVVDKFCRQWRMEINLKKSEVMVVGQERRCVCATRDQPEIWGTQMVRFLPVARTRNGAPAGECVLCSPWICRGQKLKVVRKYKYLGIWFTSDLHWDVHIGVMVQKAETRTQDLGKVLSNRRLSARAKTLVWLASVRPLLEYGCEVWRTDGAQLSKMESVQMAAGKKIFKLNSRTSGLAVRALMHVPELKTRHTKLRLNYMAKIMAMDKGRLARTVVRLAPGPTELGLGRVQHWWTVLSEFVTTNSSLSEAFGRLRRSSDRNQGVVPSGVDPTLTEFDCFPIKSWRRAVKWWALSSEKNIFLKRRDMSTIKLMRRALEKEDHQMPRFPLTKRACWGPDKIRFRLLAGMSSLNVTMSKVDNRLPTCPFDSCDEGVEDTIHFLLHCKELDSLRKEFVSQLCDRCTCDRRLGSGGEQACAEFFEDLDDAGKAMFMLGGPVDGRCPEDSTDACAREFVRKAWIVRCSTLEKQAECPIVNDLTGKERKATGQRGTIDSFFRPSGRKSDTIGLREGVAARKPTCTHTRTPTARGKRACSHTCIAQSTIGPAGHIVLGSGLNDSEYVMRSD
jgi:exonuclease III